MPLMRSLDSNTNATLRHSSPCYEVHEDDTKFQFSLDVPGVKPEDITVQVEQNGSALHLSGGRKIQRGDEVIETRFEKRFRLGRNIDASKITANLSDGVMIVTAPKDLSKEQVVKISVTQNPHE
jgi:HSP20 family protein